MIFELQGMGEQRAIIQDALDRCHFPFEKLVPKLRADTGRDRIPVEWADLSRYAAQIAAAKAANSHAHIHEGEDVGHPIEARSRVLGLAWYSDKVTIEQSLVSDPELAKEVFLSEGAHMVDFFFMDDAHRAAIFNAFHGDAETTPVDHGHDWFDKGQYSEWVGESFMGLFVRAFSNVQMTMPFAHPITDHAIRTAQDQLTPPEPEPTPVPQPEPAPTPEPTPVPEPEHEAAQVFGSKLGKTYHDKHKGIARDIEWESAAQAEMAGRRACRVCRPA